MKLKIRQTVKEINAMLRRDSRIIHRRKLDKGTVIKLRFKNRQFVTAHPDLAIDNFSGDHVEVSHEAAAVERIRRRYRYGHCQKELKKHLRGGDHKLSHERDLEIIPGLLRRGVKKVTMDDIKKSNRQSRKLKREEAATKRRPKKHGAYKLPPLVMSFDESAAARHTTNAAD